MQGRVVGVDFATNEAKVGVAFGVSDRGLSVSEAFVCTRERSAAKAVADWLRADGAAAIIAIDAPLGWPQPLAVALGKHRAGQEIEVTSNALFRRATDTFIHEKLGKLPLEVGADRIARTAYAALRFLGDLRRLLGSPIPLAWRWPMLETFSAIEVYPAATLTAHSIIARRYKRSEDGSSRKSIVEKLSGLAKLPEDTSLLQANADVLDAVVCAVAADDFLCGRAMRPDRPDLAQMEGWIWARSKKAADGA